MLATRFSWVLACLGGASLLMFARGDSAAQTADHQGAAPAPGASASESSRVIHIPGCRVMFIDQAELSSQRSGVLRYVAREGDMVRGRAVVAQLRDQVARAAVVIAEKQAENDVEIRYARKASELAQLEYVKSLQANRTVVRTVGDAELRRLRLAAEKLLLQLEQAEHDFLLAKLKHNEANEILNTYLVAAPFDGMISKVYKNASESVREGEPILEIVNPNRVRVEGFLNVNDLPRIRRGLPIQVRLDMADVDLPASGQVFDGRLAFVDARIEPVSRRVRVWAEVVNRDHLLMDGYTVTLTIPVAKSP